MGSCKSCLARNTCPVLNSSQTCTSANLCSVAKDKKFQSHYISLLTTNIYQDALFCHFILSPSVHHINNGQPITRRIWWSLQFSRSKCILGKKIWVYLVRTCGV